MNLIEVKTAELTGAALDWAVAQVDEVRTIMLQVRSSEQRKPFALAGSLALPLASEEGYAPSSCWHCGGPLIQSHQINLEWDGIDGSAFWWKATHQDVVQFQIGDTPLIAACRAIVASKFGDTVQVPAELMP